jgi:two-component system, NtrC family, response regulator HydG
MRTLLSYDFPGNIRELRNLVERACILSMGAEITSENFPVTAQTRTAGAAVDRASPITPNEVAEMMSDTLDLREFLASVERRSFNELSEPLVERRLRLHGSLAFREVTFPTSWESTTSRQP